MVFTESVTAPTQLLSEPLLPDVRQGVTDKESSLRCTQSKWHSFQGYRAGLKICAITATATFLLNLGLTLLVAERGFKDGIATIKDGKCSETKRESVFLHLGINILGTLLLGASNYTMQCLSSPTREEVNKAHRQRVPLDIGIPSLTNLRRLSWPSILLWGLLALSSLPLHLMYNSVVFSTISTNQYHGYVVSADFISGSAYHSSKIHLPESVIRNITLLRDNPSLTENLTNEECINSYHKEWLLDRSDFLAVSSANQENQSLLAQFYSKSEINTGRVGYAWTCSVGIIDPNYGSSGFSLPNQKYCSPQPAHNLTIMRYPIDYCLSKREPESCKLQFSLRIIIVVISCNLVKALCMGLALWWRSSSPLLTLGDAVASFLDEPDENTVGNCLAEKYRFRRHYFHFDDKRLADGPKEWKSKRYLWFQSAGPWRWILSIVP